MEMENEAVLGGFSIPQGEASEAMFRKDSTAFAVRIAEPAEDLWR